MISTQCSADGDFSCALYSAVVGKDDRAAFHVISNHLAASTSLSAKNMPTVMRFASPPTPVG